MIRKLIMYLSAFLPMFLIMWVKELLLCIQDILKKPAPRPWGALWCNPYLIVEIIVFALIGCSVFILIKRNIKTATYKIILKTVKNRSAEYYLAYYSLFVLALIEFSLTDLIDLAVLTMLLIVLGIVYIKNDLYFINPTINIFQSYIYEVEYDDNKTVLTKLIISPDKLYEGAEIDVDISEFEFTFLRRKNEERDQTAN